MRGSRGFTLVEVLVVLVLVSILLSLVTLLPGDDRRRAVLVREGERLIEAMRGAQFHAMTRNRPAAIDLLTDGYRMLDFTGGTWQELGAHPDRAAVTLTEGISIWQPGLNELNLIGGAQAALPELVFSPSADLPLPFLSLWDAGLELRADIVQTGVNSYTLLLSDEQDGG